MNQANMLTTAPEAAHEEDAPSNQPFRLLDLPPEIRNNIYHKVIEGYPEAYLRSSSKGKLASRSTLPRVSRLVREEFLAILYLHADVITKVNRFDFTHVVTFFNRLREVELKALPSSNVEAQRRIVVQLNPYGRDTALLSRWLYRQQHPTKKGIHVDISYVQLEGGNKGIDQLMVRSLSLFEGQLRGGNRAEVLSELRKIRKAFEPGPAVECAAWPKKRRSRKST